MIREAMEWIQERVECAHEPETVETHGPHSRRRTIVWKDGTREVFDRLRPPKTQNVKTIVAFALACKLAGGKPVVYVTLGRIMARPNEVSTEDVPDDRIDFKFDIHPIIPILRNINEGGCVINHADLRLMLSSRFGDVAYEPSNLLDLIRTVQFSALSESESEQSRDLDKLGKRMTAKVTGIEALPEKFRVKFEPTLHFPEISRQFVDFALTPIPAEQKFRLIPVAGTLNKAITQAEDDLVDEVQAECLAAGVEPAAVLAGWRE